MILLLILTALAGQPPETVAKKTIMVNDGPQEIYIENATIVDKRKVLNNEHVDFVITGAAAQYVNNYFKHDYEPIVFDNTSNIYSHDCDYEEDSYKCSVENEHWLVKTNIYLDDDVLGVSMKIYNYNGVLKASSSTNELVKTECRTPPRRRLPHPTQGSAPYDPPEQCKEVYPNLLSKNVRQAIKILFSNVRP
jgi:hypothetical protein